MSAVPAYMSRTTLAEQLDIADSTVDQLVARGILPRPLKLTPGVVRWRWADVEAALLSLSADAKPTTAPDPYSAGVANVVINNKSKKGAPDRDVP